MPQIWFLRTYFSTDGELIRLYLVFGAGFSESGIADMDAPYPSSRPSSTDMYDYSSDSDLEDEDDNTEIKSVVDGVHSEGDVDSKVRRSFSQ